MTGWWTKLTEWGNPSGPCWLELGLKRVPYRIQVQGLELELYQNNTDFPGGRICRWSSTGDVNTDKVNNSSNSGSPNSLQELQRLKQLYCKLACRGSSTGRGMVGGIFKVLLLPSPSNNTQAQECWENDLSIPLTPHELNIIWRQISITAQMCKTLGSNWKYCTEHTEPLQTSLSRVCWHDYGGQALLCAPSGMGSEIYS